jgi:hypothetical protein
MKTPSVTGRNPQVPNKPEALTLKLAACNTLVSFWLRHWKIELFLPA